MGRTKSHVGTGRLLLAGALVLSLSGGTLLAKDHKKHRGFVDGSKFASLASDDGTLVEVSINGALLRTVASAMVEENPSLADLLGGIVSINAVVCERGASDGDRAAKMAREIADDLKDDGWEHVARVREGDDNVNVLILLDDEEEGTISGITVMVSEAGGDVVFANIAGTIDLTLVSKLAHSLNIPGLHELADLDLGDAVKVREKKSRHRK